RPLVHHPFPTRRSADLSDRGDRGPRLGAAGLVVLEPVHVAVLLGAVVTALGLVLRAAARAPATAPRGFRGVLGAVAPAAVMVLALDVDDQAAAVAVLAGGREGLDQALAHPLAGHLHQTQRGDLGDLVLGAVAAQALDQA